MDSRLPLLVVNPKSGGGLNESTWARIALQLAGPLGTFDVRMTERPGDGSRLAEEAVRDGRRFVLALGGDGTISEVVNGTLRAGAGADLALIPRGTGGDFRRALDMPRDAGKAATQIMKGRARQIDVGRATYTTHDGKTATRFFVNVASFGFSSAVAARTNSSSSKKLGGRLGFFSATVRELVQYENTDIWMTIDGREPQRRKVLLAAVGNGRYFGGGMKICPNAKLDDGRLDLVVVGDMGRVEVLTKIYRLYQGTHLSLEKVRSTQISKLEASPVDPKAKIPVEIDGETPGYLPATFEIIPKALRLRF